MLRFVMIKVYKYVYTKRKKIGNRRHSKIDKFCAEGWVIDF